MAQKQQENIKNLMAYLREEGCPLSLQEIGRKFPLISHRTLQRLLTQLRDQGDIKFESEKRGRKYSAITGEKLLQGDQEVFTKQKQTQSALTYIRRPIQKREPVAYKAECLLEYEPNKTNYFSENQKKELHKIGAFVEQTLPAGTFARQILQRLLIDLSWNSSRLEGNTYSLLDTKNLIEFGNTAVGKQANETQMIFNHKQAIEYLLEISGDLKIHPTSIKNLHAALAENLLADPRFIGALRTQPVEITGSTYIPVAIPQKIEEFFYILCRKASEILDPFEKSFFLFLHLPYLQPFQDVNKRVARLAANIPFIHSNLCPLSFIDLPIRDYTYSLLSYYETTNVILPKEIFYWAYIRSAKQYQVIHQTLGDPDPFRLKYREELKTVVRQVVTSQMPLSTIEKSIDNLIPNSVSHEDQKVFTEYLMTELRALHEGNYARFRIRPSEFDAWEKLLN